MPVQLNRVGRAEVMRWFWIDRFTEFVSGKHARAVKCVSLSEDAVDEYCPGYPCLPSSLVIEGMAQTGGLLINQLKDFRERVVLAKIGNCRFADVPRPGQRLDFHAVISNLQPNGAFVNGRVERDGKLFCEMELMFAFLDDDKFAKVEQFEPAAFLRMLRLLQLFHVAVTETGESVSIPEHLLEAEKTLLTSPIP